MLTPGPRPLEAIVVVVPARNEEERAGACINAIMQAGRHPSVAAVPMHIIVVLDRCTDETGARVESVATGAMQGTPTIAEVGYGNVGRARGVGMLLALRHVGGAHPGRVWLASTDADSMVPENWLAHHARIRHRGFHGAAGTVRVRSWAEHPTEVATLHDRAYRAKGAYAVGHRHVHGANMGFTAAAYRFAGGFAAVPTGEDGLLWAGLRKAGTPVIATPRAPVTTSGRRDGRAPEGFAAFLRHLGPD